MIDWTWISTDLASLAMVLVTTLGVYIALLVSTRLSGLRSFSKMSGFDFAITVALGSVVATTIVSKTPSLLTGAFAIVALYALKWVISKGRKATNLVERIVDNEPLLVMAGEEVLTEHLNKSRMTIEDLKSKLRMAGVSHRSQVLAVVFETTGDVSVVKRGDAADPWIFEGLRGGEHLDFISDAARPV